MFSINLKMKLELFTKRNLIRKIKFCESNFLGDIIF